MSEAQAEADASHDRAWRAVKLYVFNELNEP